MSAAACSCHPCQAWLCLLEAGISPDDAEAAAAWRSRGSWLEPSESGVFVRADWLAKLAKQGCDRAPKPDQTAALE